MTQKARTFFVDLDGGEALGTVHFGLDSTQYKIDLRTDHAKKRGRLWLAISRPVGGSARDTTMAPGFWLDGH